MNIFTKDNQLVMFNVDAIMKIVNKDGALLPDKNDRIEKFVKSVEKIRDHHLDRFNDYNYELDNAMASICQGMINIARDEKDQEGECHG